MTAIPAFSVWLWKNQRLMLHGEQYHLYHVITADDEYWLYAKSKEDAQQMAEALLRFLWRLQEPFSKEAAG